MYQNYPLALTNMNGQGEEIPFKGIQWRGDKHYAMVPPSRKSSSCTSHVRQFSQNWVGCSYMYLAVVTGCTWLSQVYIPPIFFRSPYVALMWQIHMKPILQRVDQDVWMCGSCNIGYFLFCYKHAIKHLIMCTEIRIHHYIYRLAYL